MLLCNLTLSSCNDRDVCVCVCLHSTQVAGRTKDIMHSCVNVSLHVCVCCCGGLSGCQGLLRGWETLTISWGQTLALTTQPASPSSGATDAKEDFSSVYDEERRHTKKLRHAWTIPTEDRENNMIKVKLSVLFFRNDKQDKQWLIVKIFHFAKTAAMKIVFMIGHRKSLFA